VNASTAIATIATASAPAPQATVGRFAPSPTGPLHLGSLVAALGSCLDARARGGSWLVRIENLDATRVLPGCADNMLATLEAFGFAWDGPVLYQSTRLEAYRAALEQLRRSGCSYECSCSRKDLSEANGPGASPYPGTCRHAPRKAGPTATRFRVDNHAALQFDDLYQGPQRFALASVGDVIVRRRDDTPSYQLAVVVDDAMQKITHVVRGTDLLTSTAWQIALQNALSLPHVRYGHLPLVVEHDGAKLAKSRHAIALDRRRVARLLWMALQLLQQDPPAELGRQTVREIWQWALAHWRPHEIQGRARVYLSPRSDSF